MAIVEAFPSTFLGLLLADPSAVTARRGNRSDVFFQHLSTSGKLQELMGYLLPGRIIDLDLASVVNHDDRAALQYALSPRSVLLRMTLLPLEMEMDGSFYLHGAPSRPGQ